MTDYRARFTPARPGNTVSIPESAICVEWTEHCGRTGVRWLEPDLTVEVDDFSDD